MLGRSIAPGSTRRKPHEAGRLDARRLGPAAGTGLDGAVNTRSFRPSLGTGRRRDQRRAAVSRAQYASMPSWTDAIPRRPCCGIVISGGNVAPSAAEDRSRVSGGTPLSNRLSPSERVAGPCIDDHAGNQSRQPDAGLAEWIGRLGGDWPLTRLKPGRCEVMFSVDPAGWPAGCRAEPTVALVHRSPKVRSKRAVVTLSCRCPRNRALQTVRAGEGPGKVSVPSMRAPPGVCRGVPQGFVQVRLQR